MSDLPDRYPAWRSAATRAVVAGYMLWAGATAMAAAAGQAALTPALDLHADGAAAARQGGPLVLLFSLPDCAYCAVVRRNYLAPMAREPLAADRLIVRELTLNAVTPIAGFRGERSTAAALAAHYGLRVAPSVVLVGRDGALLAPPLVGGDVAGMYGAYLDQALAQARAALAATRSTGAPSDKP